MHLSNLFESSEYTSMHMYIRNSAYMTLRDKLRSEICILVCKPEHTTYIFTTYVYLDMGVYVKSLKCNILPLCRFVCLSNMSIASSICKQEKISLEA